MADLSPNDLQKILSRLPRAVQNAITSQDTQKYLRSLADKYDLHLDKWEILEKEVLLALYGIRPGEKLEENIQKEIGVDTNLAASLTEDIAQTIFRPIREELERELGAPQAREEDVSDMEKLRREALGAEGLGIREQVIGGEKAESQSNASSLQPTTYNLKPPPGTPPPLPPTEKIVRAPASGAYIPGEPSTARANVVDDPYREPPL